MDIDPKRELGTIESVFSGVEPDHEITTCSLFLRFRGSSTQGFGNLILNDNLLHSFRLALCEVFDVAMFEDLKGEECFALRCWGHHSDNIEGVESVKTGKRFTLTGWRKGVGQAKFTDPLEQRRDSLIGELVSHQRRCNEIAYEIRNLSVSYTDWSK